MYEPAASTTVQAGFALARVAAAADTISSAVAGFALLAGARAFMFFALLGWREPVLGGAGLLLLALIGWLRWRCGNENRSAVALSATRCCAWPGRSATARAGEAHESRTALFHADGRAGQARNVACYNRPIIAIRRVGAASSADTRLDTLRARELRAVGFAAHEPDARHARSTAPTAPTAP